MKKYFGVVGVLVMVLAFGVLFTSCENDVQEVKGNVGINYAKANAVASVTAKEEKLVDITTGNSYPAGTYSYIYLSWDAAENVSGYTVFYQQEGKNTVQQFSTSSSLWVSDSLSISGQMGYGGYVFDTTSTYPSYPLKRGEVDVDKWYALGPRKVVVSGTPTTTYRGGPFSIIEGQKYRFGVRTSPLSFAGDATYSDIVWSDYLQF